MTLNRGVLGVLALAFFIVSNAEAAEQKPGQVDGLIRENILVPFVQPGTPPAKLDAVLTRPAAPGRYPLIVLSHGTPRDAAARAETRPTTYSAIAVEFARRGWVVVAATRRGYGRSEGEYAERTPCNTANYERSALTAAQDVTATVAHMKQKDFVDPNRYLYMGVSVGGLASIATASLPQQGLMGAVNFAGGRGSTAPDVVCRPEQLIATMGMFGKTVRVPTLWIYAENDHFFGPDLARKMFAAFQASGGAGEFVMAAPFGQDGHTLFTGNGGMNIWLPMVGGFFTKNGWSFDRKPANEALVRLPAPRNMSDSVKKDYPLYLSSLAFEKAFAISSNGKTFAWRTGQRTPEEAAAAALKACNGYNTNPCEIYAVNNQLAE